MDDLGDLIASLVLDASRIDDLRTPTAAEIRARVAAFTPEQHAAARAEGMRADIPTP